MIKILRILGNVEGVSYLLLLFIAMPLKYAYDMPMAVKITGMAHGCLLYTSPSPRDGLLSRMPSSA